MPTTNLEDTATRLRRLLPEPREAGGRRVLVVDDHDDSRWILAEAFGHGGYAVETAPDGRTAIEKAIAFSPDAIVLDLALPDLDGLAVASVLSSSERLRGVAILAFTVLDAADVEEEAFRAGCRAVLSKPARPARIVEAVRRALEEAPDRPAPPPGPPT